MRFDALVAALFPEQSPLSGREKAVSALAAFVAIALVIWASQALALSEHRQAEGCRRGQRGIRDLGGAEHADRGRDEVASDQRPRLGQRTMVNGEE